MNKELLEKYCKNTCTDEELDYVLEWFRINSGTSDGKALLWKIWKELPDDKLKVDLDLILDKIHHKANLKKPGIIRGPGQLSTERKSHFIKILMKAAAILMLPILGFGLYMSHKYQNSRRDLISANMAYNEVFSSVDAITKVSLPDGTVVWLNHSSTLKYPAVFNGKSRDVELIGEGYFEVATDPRVPFIVRAGDIRAVARGTKFNILAYPGEDRIETSLIEGNVTIQRLDENSNIIDLAEMKPSEMVIYRKSSKDIISHINTDERYYSWKDGKLIFKKEPMGEVVRKLGRWFNVDIQIKDSSLYDLTYTATFIQETLPQVLELLSRAAPVNYSISNRTEMSDGSYSKRKVVLTYRNKSKK